MYGKMKDVCLLRCHDCIYFVKTMHVCMRSVFTLKNIEQHFINTSPSYMNEWDLCISKLHLNLCGEFTDMHIFIFDSFLYVWLEFADIYQAFFQSK